MAERACAFYVSLGLNAALGIALHNTCLKLAIAQESARFHTGVAAENAMNRILIEKVETYGNLIASRLPSS